jgi:hypothetical protein
MRLRRISFFDPAGVALGQMMRTLGPREALQINDVGIAAALGGSGDVPSFYAIVEGDPRSSVFSYAAVLDNQSEDLIFVPGKNAGALGDHSVTLPAAASLHGVGGAFFHSDVAITNLDASSTSVRLDFRCFVGTCSATPQTVSLDPGQSRLFEDIVGTTFGSPESGGGVEVGATGSVVVTSRLYTPSHPSPTVGMFVPGLGNGDTTPQAVLTSLSHSADPSKGFRVNVGAFNGTDTARTVTFRLFSGAGQPLGQTGRTLLAREAVQLNDLFGRLGIHGDVVGAYCLVDADGLGALYPYAAVIDNQSQDPIFIPGQNDPEPPPATTEAGSLR